MIFSHARPLPLHWARLYRVRPARGWRDLAFACVCAASLLPWVRAKADPASGSAVAPSVRSAKAVRLSYQLYGHGFHLLDVVVNLRLTTDGYSILVHDHTVGFMGMMVRADVTSSAIGRYVPHGVRPVQFRSDGYSRGAQRDTELAYIDGNPVVRTLKPIETNRDPIDIANAKASIDSLSAIADLVHEVQQTGRCDGSALVFDGLRLSRATASTIGQQTVPQDDRSPYGGTALRCDYVSQQLAGFLHNEDEAKMHQPQHGSAWLAPLLPDAPALPLRMSFENPKFGVATMFLTKVEEMAVD